MAWTYATCEGDPAPHAMVYTRQGVPELKREASFVPEDVYRGGYVLSDAPSAKVCLIATGSEVGLAVEAQAALAQRGVPARVVSMPSIERFLAQDAAYRASVLPGAALKVSIEAGRSGPWAMLTGTDGLNFGVDWFGESAPYKEVYAHFHLTPEDIADAAQKALA